MAAHRPPTIGSAVQRIVQGTTTIDGTHRLYTYERAAFPTVFGPSGPSGPCGWVWDGIGGRSYYHGDCDRPVIGVTSIAARGSHTLLTLNDGRVFAPEPLSQVPLSYLVPAADGTYLGAGVGAAGDCHPR